MRAKDARTADCIRMIKTKHMERRTAAGFKGPLDDSLWLDVIATYQKQLRKSREEYVAVGERGADALPQLDFEIAFCARFLPKAAVGRRGARRRARDARAPRRLRRQGSRAASMGEIMKANKGKFEPSRRQAHRRGRAGAEGVTAEPRAPRAFGARLQRLRRPGARACRRRDPSASGLSTVTARACAGAGRSGGARAARAAAGRRRPRAAPA